MKWFLSFYDILEMLRRMHLSSLQYGTNVMFKIHGDICISRGIYMGYNVIRISNKKMIQINIMIPGESVIKSFDISSITFYS